MQYNKAEERKAWDDIAFRLGVVVVVVVGRVRFGIGDCAMRAAQSGLKVKVRLPRTGWHERPSLRKKRTTGVQGRLIIPSWNEVDHVIERRARSAYNPFLK